MKKAVAYANANIALVKYWGKSDSVLNIPSASSLSMTLSDLGTVVTVSASDTGMHVSKHDGQLLSELETRRLNFYLEQIRTLFPYKGFLQILCKNSIPYATGLASSASFFAALAVALNSYLH